MKKWTLIALSVLALSACQDKPTQNAAASTTTPAASSGKVYRVAIEREFSPFIIPDPNAATTGFEAELLSEIAKTQGFEITFEPTLWEKVLPQLDTGEADIAGSGIIMTSERLSKWDFSEPYIVTKYAAVVPEDSNISKSADLKTKRVSSSKGSELAAFAVSQGVELVPADSIFLSIKETMNRNVEATVVNAVIGDYFTAKYPETKLKVVAFDDAEIPLGYAVKKGNTELKQKLDEGLNKLKSDGTYDKLKQKWNIS